MSLVCVLINRTNEELSVIELVPANTAVVE